MKTHKLTLSKKHLKHCTDMLGYDGAYKARDIGDEIEVFTWHYTPGRWASFNVYPSDALYDEFGIKENDIRRLSEGFLQALMLVQELFKDELEVPLTEARMEMGLKKGEE